MARGRYEVKATTESGRAAWYWRLVGANNEIICSSHPETYQYPTDARAAAKNARRVALRAKVDR